jgi:hypothetical protein
VISVPELLVGERARATRRNKLSMLAFQYGTMWVFEVQDIKDGVPGDEMPSELWIAHGCCSGTFGMRIEEDTCQHLEAAIRTI